MREICTNPLLFTMLLDVYQKTEKVPPGRGSLYRMFIDLHFQWGDDRDLGKKVRKELERLLVKQLTDKELYIMARKVLVDLTACMPATSIKWNNARNECEKIFVNTAKPTHVTGIFLEYLVQKRILCLDTFHRIRFFHHTIQEYYHACSLSGRDDD